jgi:hypothetical protein
VTGHQKKALVRFCSALGCVAVGVFFGAVSLWLMSFLALYSATFFLWSGFRNLKRHERIRREVEWWRRAKDGVEQDPLNPCCVEFGETGFLHDEQKCTRYRYGRPRPISKEEREEIDKAWSEIIAHFYDQS